MHRQHAPQRPPARPHTMVRSEKAFLSAPSCAASARAPLSARLRYPPGVCRLYYTKHAYIYSPVIRTRARTVVNARVAMYRF